ncbi:YGGT family protein [Microbacterium azadirachtae]|uniref:YGGT family protein n=1 Tax=Microbacterium azadirachtae TaxID=582680 RepID=A0A0F0K985_9MICO|nr:YGGT family protein [Microbacterium azadirachtae]SDL15251.1 YggT family protein [Microbacterium azadirachtae]SEF44951.1 YggT family protein [Microbacterium azadirachtae]SEF44956.1 YggT family protein [Microbacterium azadirachtae]SFR31853.1 YggT family protein [Microbacterium azadirachtae]
MAPAISVIAAILNILLLLYLLTLFVRVILEWIPVFNRSWRPRGAGLIAAEIVYTITDPPIRMFRRLIPPLRIGPVALDMGLTLTMIVVLILISITRSFI